MWLRVAGLWLRLLWQGHPPAEVERLVGERIRAERGRHLSVVPEVDLSGDDWHDWRSHEELVD